MSRSYSLTSHLEKFPQTCVVEKGSRLYGIWMIGNQYKRTSDYYGSYPPSYLDRVYSLFPNHRQVLHLFSGKVNSEIGVRFDLREDVGADVVGDAHYISKYFPEDTFDLVIADPPYSKEDAKEYGTSLPVSWKVLREVYPIVQPDGFVVWLSTKPPMYRGDMWKLAGLIGLHVGTNKVFRAVTILQSIK